MLKPLDTKNRTHSRGVGAMLQDRQDTEAKSATAESVKGLRLRGSASVEEAHKHQRPVPGTPEEVDPAVSYLNTD